jgi:ABC-type multidrug transport system fused ATPase/permease subunit
VSRPHRTAFVYGSLATAGVVAMRLALPWPLRGIVENVFAAAAGATSPLTPTFGGNPVLVYCGLYLLLSLATGAFEWIQRVWMARVASRTAHDLRTMAVSRLGPSHDRSAAETADLLTRVIGDVARIRADLKGILIHLGQNGLLLLAITALFLYLAPKLGLLFLVGGLLAILIGYQAVEPVARTAAKHRSKESAYAAAIQEEEDDEPESLAISESSTRKDVRTTRIIGRSTLLVHGAVAATISLALWIGVGDVRAGTLAPGELFLFIAYAITIQRRAVMIGRQIARGGKLLANTERLGRLIDSADEETASARLLKEAIRLEDLRLKRFPTQTKQARLGPIDLTIERGQRVLVLGNEGSGKSSLLAALAGRLEARRGAIWWDDEDVAATPETLRASVAYVSDEPEFGRIAVRRLLGLSAGEEPDESALEVLKKLGTWTVVRRLRDRLDQRVPSSHLSPRERRALLLGRVVTGDDAVWILDNPVDHDRSRDRERLETILERAGERTLVVALRRPIAVERFDRVILMKQGTAVFDGTPADWKARRRQLREIRGA